MPRIRISLKVFSCLAFAFVVLGQPAAQVSVPRPSFGDEWLSWAEETKILFAGAYLSGYRNGSVEACNVASALFDEPGKQYTNLAQIPERRCIEEMRSYSKEPEEYAGVITAFYTDNPRFRNIPYTYLVQRLTDDQYTTAEGLYERAVRGEIRTRF